MDTNNKQRKLPVKPYDDSMWDQWTIYDNIPYIMDKDVCKEGSIAWESGNIIKFYRCQIKEPYEIKH